MLTSMSLQLIGSSESLSAEHPVTDERPLAGVPSQMRPEMRSLSIHFVASGDVTNVLLLPVGASIRHDAIGTCTSNATYSRLYILITAHIDVDVD